MSKSKNYQKFLSATIAVATVASTNVIPYNVLNVEAKAPNFTDIKQGTYYYDAVIDLVGKGVIQGFEDGTFKPYQTTTRGQASAMIARALDLDDKKVTDPGFSDVSKNDRFYHSIAALVESGIVDGVTKDSFQPNRLVTRAEMAKMITNAFGLKQNKDHSVLFTDVPNNSWYAGFVKALHDNGVTIGKTETTFAPSENVHRGQLATFIYRAQQNSELTSVIEKVTDSAVTIDGESYIVSENLQKLFNSRNTEVLKNANIHFEEKDGVITSVKNLEITESGKAAVSGQDELSGHLVLDGQGTMIDGNVIINGDYVKVKNLTVKGNLELNDGVQSNFYGKNVNVEGKTFVAVGEPKQSVNVNISSTIFQQAADEVNNTSVTFEDSSLGTLEMKSGKTSLSVKGSTTIKELVVEVKNSKITVDKDSNISNITLPTGAKIEDVVENYNEVQSSIGKVNGEATSSPSSGGGGGGGGSSTIKAPAVAADTTNLEFGNDIELIFTDSEKWRNNVTTVEVDGAVVEASKYTITEGKVTLDKSLFTEAKVYSIVIKANRYKNATVSQTIEPVAAPAVAVDTTNVEIGNGIELTFTDNAAWRSSISTVEVDGAVVEASKYTITEGKVTLDKSLFTEAKAYSIVIKANGYTSATVSQTIEPAAAAGGIPAEITEAGTYGPETGTQTIEGNLVVKSPSVTLKNLVIEGDLIIDEAVGDGEVYLEGVEVKGTTTVRGGGENSIYFKDSVLVTVIVNKNDGRIRIVAQGNTTVADLQLESYVDVEEGELTGNAPGFTNVTLGEGIQNVDPELQVQLEGTFDTINSRAANVRIHLPAETSIETLVVSAIAAISGTGMINTAQINVGQVVLEQSPSNLVLQIPNGGAVNIGGTPHNESYSESETAALTSIKATQGMINLEFDQFVADITKDDFDVTATIDGGTINLSGLDYSASEKKFFYNPVNLEGNIGKTLAITVTPKGEKVTGESKTANVIIGTGFQGRITDIQGVGMANVKIKFREGLAQTGEFIDDATTDQNGYYSINLPAGAYTGELEGEEVVTSYIYAVAPSDYFGTNQNETAIRAAASNELKIMLSWGEEPSDVDSHLYGPTLGSNGRFHTYYGDKTYQVGDIIYADLDWDDMQSYGPETTTIRKLIDGTYTFIVHNWSGSPALRTSEAKVEVFKGRSKVADKTFTVPTGEGEERYWKVFNIIVSNNGQDIEVEPINTLHQSNPESNLEVNQLRGYLAQKINNVTSLLEEAEEGTQVGQYQSGAKADLQAALTEAQAVLNNGASTTTELLDVLDSLSTAAYNFEGLRVVDGTEFLQRLADLKSDAENAQEGNGLGEYAEGTSEVFLTEIDRIHNVATSGILTEQALMQLEEDLDHAHKEFKLGKMVQVSEYHLLALIDEAQAIYDAAEEGTEVGQFSAEALDKFSQAISTTTVVAEKEIAREREIYEVTIQLENAIWTFKESAVGYGQIGDLIAALHNQKEMAQQLINDSEEGQYSLEAIQALQQAINDADSLLAGEVNLQDLPQAINDLTSAIEAFLASEVIVPEAPAVLEAYPDVTNDNGTSVDLLLGTNEDSTAYYVVLPKDALAPTAEQIMAGKDSHDVEVELSGSTSLTANTEKSVDISGLTADSSYKIYVVAVDGDGNKSTRHAYVLNRDEDTAPTDSNLSISGLDDISGEAIAGETLTANYTLDAEESVQFQWYRADDANGTNKLAIPGATSNTYEPTSEDIRKYISVEATPIDSTGTAQGPVVSSDFAQVTFSMHLELDLSTGPRVIRAILGEGNQLAYMVKTEETELEGSSLPTEAITDYNVGEVIPGVDSTTNKYLYLFEYDSNNNIVNVWHINFGEQTADGQAPSGESEVIEAEDTANTATFTAAAYNADTDTLEISSLTNVETDSSFHLNQLTYSAGEETASIAALGGNYTLVAALEEVDQAGEYFYDAETGTLTIILVDADSQAIELLPDFGANGSVADTLTAVEGWNTDLANNQAEVVLDVDVTVASQQN